MLRLKVCVLGFPSSPSPSLASASALVRLCLQSLQLPPMAAASSATANFTAAQYFLVPDPTEDPSRTQSSQIMAAVAMNTAHNGVAIPAKVQNWINGKA